MGLPLYRGQGPDGFKTSTPIKAAKRGQSFVYDINGKPQGPIAGALADGTYGDVTVSGTGTVFTVAQATKLRTARTISISGKATSAGGTFDGTGNLALNITSVTLVAADIPNIAESQVTNLTTDLAGKQASSALLTAYAGAAWSAGVQIPTLTAANTVALKTVGSATGNILDKASGDALYLAIGGTATAATKLATGRTIGITGDVTWTSPTFDGTSNVTATATVTRINGVALSGLATGILKNTTATGAPSIAVAADFPTLNQSTTGSAATLTTPRTISITGKATAAGGTFDGSAALAINVTALTIAATDLPAITGGDVTASAGSAVHTIAADAVTYAKMQNVSATSRFIGRITAGAGDPEELTGTQATTLLDAFTSALKGLAPASGGGTTNFLRADGTWAAPAGGGTVTSVTGTANEITVTGTTAPVLSLPAAMTFTGKTVTGGTFSTPTLTTPVINGLPTGTGVAATSTASTLAARDASKNILANNFLADYTTTVTAAGTTTLTVASTYLQFFTGTTTQTITLPVASTLALGQQFQIVNLSTGALTVNSSGGNLVLTIAGGTSATITCILTSGTAAASWSTGYWAANVAGGKVLTASNTLTLTGTDGSSIAFGTGGTVLYTADAGAWISWTPTITAGTGTFTTVSATGKYKQIGKLVFFRLEIVITTNGTAASYVQATMPVTAISSFNQTCAGKEDLAFGFFIGGTILSGTANMRILKYDATYPGATGNTLHLTGVYEAA